MGTWEWTVDGKTVRGEGETEAEAWDNYNFVNPGKEAGGPGRGYPLPKPATSAVKEGFKNVAKGYVQGVLDPFEGGAQFIEHVTGHKIAPEWLRSKFRNYRTEARSTAAGAAGEVLGNIFNPAFLVPGALLARAPAAFSAAGIGGRALLGAAGGAAQPVEGAANNWDYAKAKGWQALAGGTAGVLAPSLGNLAGQWAAGLPHALSLTHPLRAAVGATVGPTIATTGNLVSRMPAGGVGRAAGEVFTDAADEGEDAAAR